MATYVVLTNFTEQGIRNVMDTVQRADAVRELAKKFGVEAEDGLRVTHDLTQEELAQLVGASRETVNKALADFVHRGWIQLQGKSVVVLDEERLRRRAR